MGNHAKPVRIAALGMEQRTYSTLQLFFHGHCQDSYVLVEEKSADISIIDMDGFQAYRMLEEHKKHYPDQPSILISLSDNKAHDAVYVRKPIQLEALSSALRSAKKRLQQQPVAKISVPKISVKEVAEAKASVAKNTAKNTPKLQTADNTPNAVPPVLNDVIHRPKTVVKHAKPGSNHFNQYRYAADALTEDTDIELIDTKLAARFNPLNPVQVAKFQYQSKQTLQGYFQQAYFMALQKKRNIVLKGAWRPITILYKSKQLRVEKNFRHLYALSGMFFDKSEVSIAVLDNSVDCEPSIHETVLPAEPFLWKLSMRTSRGRVPVDTNFTAPIKLIRWPNFTRTIVTPHALRIAALWAKRPTSLVDTANYLAIPLQYVFIFYNAAVSLNFVTPEMAKKDRTTTSSPPVKRHQYRKIFQDLLDRLRNN
ncbi:MAG: hypothetical protein GXP08_15845 [Gammaproteobacteria bacterium]|nr:hypothetical protein [Gammaproteobacteria bacterium]